MLTNSGSRVCSKGRGGRLAAGLRDAWRQGRIGKLDVLADRCGAERQPVVTDASHRQPSRTRDVLRYAGPPRSLDPPPVQNQTTSRKV